MPEPRERPAAALQDRYALEGHLGQGGMVTVYLVEDSRHRRKVAAGTSTERVVVVTHWFEELRAETGGR